MKARVYFLAMYCLFWIALFGVTRALFLAYYASLSAQLDPATLIGAELHGLQLDLSAMSYIAVVPFFLVSLSTFFPGSTIRILIGAYTGLLLLFVALLTVIDLGLYAEWGFRLDNTPLLYTKSPSEMLVGAGSTPLGSIFLIFITLSAASMGVFAFLILPRVRSFARGNVRTFVLLVVLTASLFIPMRGGVGWMNLKLSSVYFSDSYFANHAAINVGWNFFHSLLHRSGDGRNPYEYLSAAESRRIADSVLVGGSNESSVLLNTSRPNIIVILWESLTAKAVERLGGLSGITPEFDRLTREGILFDRVYAASPRTHTGLVAILSGLPSQSKTVARAYRKTALRTVSRDLGRHGYNTAFYYGGNLDFADKKSYVLTGGFDRVISHSDFPSRDRSSHWGVPDHLLFPKALDETRRLSQPFFAVILTLSSHQPYDIQPSASAGMANGSVSDATNQETKFLNSLEYADRALGDFIRLARKESWWTSTLIVIMADHGHRLPVLVSTAGPGSPDRFHVPMLWLGGAVAKHDTVVRRVISQLDFPNILLAQLGVDARHYEWGKNSLAKDASEFAFYVFDEGFGVVDTNGTLAVGTMDGRVYYRTGKTNGETLRAGQAFMQLAFQDYLNIDGARQTPAASSPSRLRH